jgi:hypothetical protein
MNPFIVRASNVIASPLNTAGYAALDSKFVDICKKVHDNVQSDKSSKDLDAQLGPLKSILNSMGRTLKAAYGGDIDWVSVDLGSHNISGDLNYSSKGMGLEVDVDVLIDGNFDGTFTVSFVVTQSGKKTKKTFKANIDSLKTGFFLSALSWANTQLPPTPVKSAKS